MEENIPPQGVVRRPVATEAVAIVIRAAPHNKPGTLLVFFACSLLALYEGGYNEVA